MVARIQDYDYPLPQDLVAQYPQPRRDSSRLLVLERAPGALHHSHFQDLPQWLNEGDLLVVNNTRVFPARLRGVKDTGGKVELLLHHLPVREANDLGEGARGRGPLPPLPNSLPQPPEGCQGGVAAWAQATYRGRLQAGQILKFGEALQAQILALPRPGVAEVRFFSVNGNVCQAVLAAGEMPLPPYIRRPAEEKDRESYQTLFAAWEGAIACPTAGLHFTPKVIKDLARRGIEVVSVTLHVGPGTFKPVRHNDYRRHCLEPEYFELSQAAATRLTAARSRKQRLVAVGSTSARLLEHCAGPGGFTPQTGWCDLFIYPGYRFKAVDRLLTNFHLPKSTLLLLVSAFAGRELIMQAYEAAIKERYRFYSYGDCMLIL